MGLKGLGVNPGRGGGRIRLAVLDWVLGSEVSGFLATWASVSNLGEEKDLDLP